MRRHMWNNEQNALRLALLNQMCAEAHGIKEQ